MAEICCICGEALDPDNSTQCQLCGGHYHMPWSTKAQAKECGGYMLHQWSGSIIFVCKHCKEQPPDAEGQPPSHQTTI